MGETTYNFSGISSPSGTHFCKKGHNGTPPAAGGNLTDETEASTTEYGRIDASDNTYFEYIEKDKCGFRMRFVVSEDRATITRIDVKVEASAEGDVDNGWKLYIRNNSTPAWEQLATTGSGGDVELTGNKTANITDYIDADGYCFVLAKCNLEYECGCEPTMKVDYAEIKVTYSAGPDGDFFLVFNV